MFLIMFVGTIPAKAQLTPLNQSEMKAATGGGAVDFEIIGNTARAYFDVHIETYAEIDSIKLGYYKRDADKFETMKFLAPEDPMVKMGGDERTFQLWDYINSSNPAMGAVPAGKVPVYYKYDIWGLPYGTLLGYKTPPSWKGYGADASYWTASVTADTAIASDFRQGTPTGYNATTPFNSYVYIESDGTTKHYVPYTANSNYQTKYNDTLGQRYIEGLQGRNDESLLGVDYFSSAPSLNQNIYDWDINLENVRLGTDTERPMVIDGLVLMLKYDDITKSDKKLTDIIIGSNSLEGDFFGDNYRMTGFLSPKLPHAARNASSLLSLEQTGHFSQVFNEAPVPVNMIRDSFLYLVDHYRFQYYDDVANEEGKTYPAIPDNPTSNNMHTGAFLRMGLDPDSPNFGWALVMGYNEIIAQSYKPAEFIHQSLRNQPTAWWD